MAPLAQDAIQAVRDYLKTNPGEIGRAVRNALGLRFSLPIAALKWLGRQAESSGKVENLNIEARPPGIAVSAEVDLMATPVRASAVVFIERMDIGEDQLMLTVRLEEVSLVLTGESSSPVAALIKSGALDLSNPGTLAGFMPGRSPVLVSAEGNRLVLDFMKVPKLGRDPTVRRVVALLTAFLTVHGIETDPDHLDVVFRAFPRGLVTAARALGEHLIYPSVVKMLPRPA